MKAQLLMTLIPLFSGIFFFAHALPYKNTREYSSLSYNNENKSSVDQLRYQLNNQESELHTFGQKIENLEIILESLREELNTATNLQKQQSKTQLASFENRITLLEKNLSADVKLLQTHANETTAVLASFKQKMADWEQKFHSQNQNIENLQAALQNVLEAFQLKGEPVSINSKIYTVKKGDSLEKIARMHQTTIQTLREINGMPKTEEKIRVGSKIKVP